MSSKEWRTSNFLSIPKSINIENLINNKTISTYDNELKLIWYDRYITNYEEDDQYTVSQLYLIMKSIFMCTNEQKCLEYINEVCLKNQLFLIISGSIGENFLPKINDLSQINSIYIFCGRKTKHEVWAKKYVKIKGVFDDITELCECLKSDKQKLECDQMCQKIVDIFPTIKEKDINNIIHSSETVTPYIQYKQQMEFSDTGIWPCVSVVDSDRNQLVSHIHSVIDTVKYFNSTENLLKHIDNHPIDPHLVVISNPINAEYLHTLIHYRVQRVYIYCSNTRLNEYDQWSKNYPNIVFVLQHFHTLTRLILWQLSAFIMNIGEYYDRENKKDLAQARYRYVYRLHVIIQSNLNNQIETIEYTQPEKLNN